jgi:hypothetical protein
MEIKKVEVGDGPTLKAEVGGEPTLAEIYKFLPEPARKFKLVIYTSDAPCYISKLDIDYNDQTIQLS